MSKRNWSPDLPYLDAGLTQGEPLALHPRFNPRLIEVLHRFDEWATPICVSPPVCPRSPGSGARLAWDGLRAVDPVSQSPETTAESRAWDPIHHPRCDTNLEVVIVEIRRSYLLAPVIGRLRTLPPGPRILSALGITGYERGITVGYSACR